MNPNRKRAAIKKRIEDVKATIEKFYKENPKDLQPLMLAAMSTGQAVQAYHSLQVMIQQPVDYRDVLDVTLG